MSNNRTLVLTSFPDNAPYVPDFFSSFENFWPADVDMRVYYEGVMPAVPGPRYQLVSLLDVPHMRPFLDKIHDIMPLRGIVGNQYSIIFDIWRWSRKVLAQYDACEQAIASGEYARVIWLDADIVTHAPVTHEHIASWIPEDCLLAHLGRPQMYTESGFVGFNLRHALIKGFLGHYRNVLTSFTFLFLTGWTDCHILDMLIADIKRQDIATVHDLGEGVSVTESQHVFINSVLGAVMDHRKGSRKDTRSTDADLAIKRDEPYWQQGAA